MVAGFFLRLADDHRVILFDRRGTGCSTRGGRPTVEAHVDDLRCVLDAADSDRPVLIAFGDAAPAAALFAATHPGRVRALVMIGGGGSPSPEVADEIRADWGGPVRIGILAPSLADDSGYRHWWASLLRSASTPTCAVELLERAAAVDVTPVLAAIRAPTLVVHRTGDRVCPPASAVKLAAQIRTARRVELPGADHVPWAGDGDAVLAAIRDFVDDLPTEVHSTTAAAAVLAVTTRNREDSGRIRALVVAEVARHGGVPAAPRPGQIALKLFDRPARAIRCARALIELARQHSATLSIGIDVGPVAMGRSIEGVVVERAAALAAAAKPGEILSSAALIELVADSTVGELEVREVGGQRAYVSAVA